jgi:hypothetical protein
MRDVPLTDRRQEELRESAKQRRNIPDAKKYQPYGGEKDTYVSPNFGDGGWHTTPGCQLFVTEWEPRNDHIMVRITDTQEIKTSLVIPESARTVKALTRKGIVLKCGPGKWVPGEWWYCHVDVEDTAHFDDDVYEWRWIPGHRQEMLVQPGAQVVIGQWTDWESADAGWGENVVICQQADVRVIL